MQLRKVIGNVFDGIIFIVVINNFIINIIYETCIVVTFIY
jgi:hypothetical protein